MLRACATADPRIRGSRAAYRDPPSVPANARHWLARRGNCRPRPAASRDAGGRWERVRSARSAERRSSGAHAPVARRSRATCQALTRHKGKRRPEGAAFVRSRRHFEPELSAIPVVPIAVLPLATLAAFLGLDRQGGDRAGFEALHADLFA